MKKENMEVEAQEIVSEGVQVVETPKLDESQLGIGGLGPEDTARLGICAS